MLGFQSITAVTISGAFVFGMLLVLLESLRTMLAKRLNLSETRLDWLVAALNLTLIPMMPISGILCDDLGVKGVFLVGSLTTVLAVFALAMSTTTVRTVGAILLAGVGGACLSTASSVLMSKAFFPDNEPASQNLGNVFFGLGALVTPGLIITLFRRLDYRRAVGVVALLCLLPAFFAAFTEQSEFETIGGAAEWTAMLRNPIIWLAGLVFLLYGPLEGMLSSWATQYLTDRGFRARAAVWFLSGFWFMFLAARLVTALLQEQGDLPKNYSGAWLNVGLALAAAVFLGNMAGARTGTSGAVGLLLVGAVLGPIFPTLVGMLFVHFPHARGTAFGSMFAIGAVGNLVLPPLIGSYARRRTVQRALVIAMVIALLLALVALIFCLCLPLFRDQ
ncbi:MAG TPA: MFS transporter [Gemmataceae bacterium]|nr:MFS transporter [Gemmataceae bacterium]